MPLVEDGLQYYSAVDLHRKPHYQVTASQLLEINRQVKSEVFNVLAPIVPDDAPCDVSWDKLKDMCEKISSKAKQKQFRGNAVVTTKIFIGTTVPQYGYSIYFSVPCHTPTKRGKVQTCRAKFQFSDFIWEVARECPSGVNIVLIWHMVCDDRCFRHWLSNGRGIATQCTLFARDCLQRHDVAIDSRLGGKHPLDVPCACTDVNFKFFLSAYSPRGSVCGTSLLCVNW